MDDVTYRPLLFSIAYGMTGSVGDAEDIVQDAFLGATRARREGTAILDPKAYRTTTVTRRGMNYLRSARVRRETYVGSWLPEPVVLPADGTGPAEHAELADSLSMAFLVLLENLTPVERAVFMLHEVFGYTHAEIATIVGKSEPNCRQIFARSRSRISAGQPLPPERRPDSTADRHPSPAHHPETTVDRHPSPAHHPETTADRHPSPARQAESTVHRHPSPAHLVDRRPSPARRAESAELARRFFDAVTTGDLDALLETLAPDVVSYGDGGGKAPALATPLSGRPEVARFLLGLFRRVLAAGIHPQPCWVNGRPGAVLHDPAGNVLSVLELHITAGQIHAFHGVVNPDKLTHVAPAPNPATDVAPTTAPATHVGPRPSTRRDLS